MYIKNRYTSYNLEKDEHIVVHPFEECLMSIKKRSYWETSSFVLCWTARVKYINFAISSLSAPLLKM